jgi:hypothetical protein
MRVLCSAAFVMPLSGLIANLLRWYLSPVTRVRSSMMARCIRAYDAFYIAGSGISELKAALRRLCIT